MPVGQRLARALSPSPHPRPWHLLGAAAAFGPAAVAELVAPCRIQRGGMGGRRTYSHATVPRQQPDANGGEPSPASAPAPAHDQQAPASASIFEELFPSEARPHRTDTPTHEHMASTPAREEVLEEIRQWLQSELEAEASGDGSASASTSSGSHTKMHQVLRSPKGDWGQSAPTSTSSAHTVAGPSSVAGAAPHDAQPTILVLSGTTPSLMPSDFFRIAPRITDSSGSAEDDTSPSSRPVEGWSASNGGIYKIVQDRDPVTLAPRGRYYLYFGQPVAALAYAQEMRELHRLARRAVMPALAGKSNSRRLIRRRNEDRNAVGYAGAFSGDSANAEANDTDPFANVTGSITTSSSGLAANSEGSSSGVNGTKQASRRTKNSYSNTQLLATGSEEHMEALRNFSLVVPTVRLHLSVQMPSDGHGMFASSKKGRRNVQVTLYDSEAVDDAAAADTTTKVLVVLTLTGNTTSAGSYSSYVNADGRGVTTVAGLRSLIAEDGARRNLPWGVSHGFNGVVPVRWLVDEQNRLMRKARAAALQSQEQPAEKPAETPAEEKLVEGKPVEPAEDNSAKEEPAAETPAAETPAEEKPVEGKPAEEKPAEEKTAGADAEETGAEAQPDGKAGTEETGADAQPDDKAGTEEPAKPKNSKKKKKTPALPTALWASRVPNLTAKADYMNEGARFSRFVVSFSDNAEARRFVRGWHRRTVNVQLEYGLSRSAALAAMQAAWERGDSDELVAVPAVVEATVLW